MAKYINADELKAELLMMEHRFSVCEEYGAEGRVLWSRELIHREHIEKAIDKLATSDVRKNVSGEWIYKDGKTCCSKCFSPYGVRYDGENNFCPNCGADMRGEK